MKVLIITGVYPNMRDPANAIFVHKQAVELQNKGVKVAVMDVDLRSLRHKRNLGFRKEIYEGIEVFRVSFPLGKLASYLRSLCKRIPYHYIKKVIKDWGKPDVLHVHLVESANDFSRLLNSQNEIPKVVTEHRCLWLNGKKFHDVRREETKYVYQSANQIINVSSVQAAFTLKQYNYHATVIPNYIDEHFKPFDNKQNEKFTFISVGNFEYRKRFDLTISAFSEFHRKHINSELLLVGNGSLFNEMQELTAKLGLNESVVFMGRVLNKEMDKIYNMANVFVLPSMDESFGIVYAEAAACGLPVIATDCGGPVDIVTENNGVIVATESVKELVGAMEYIYNAYQQYDSELMSNEILLKFGSDAVISKIVSLYEGLVDGK